jgi:hypothetical protein
MDNMNLDQEQKDKVAAWIAEGIKLSEIQQRLESEFGIRMTYLDVRFLVDDLKLTPKDEERPVDRIPEASPAADQIPGSPANAVPNPGPTSAPGQVSVTVDAVTRPGSVISGKVRFSDGNSAEWFLDQMGRLGLAPVVQGYKPSPEDLQAFQTELQNQIQKMGY